MKTYPAGKKVGYLGGGQLARMLCQSAQSLGLEAHCLSNSPQDPAAQVTGFWMEGALDQTQDLKKFMANLDVVSFESEFIDPDIIEQALQDLTTQVHPSTQVMRQLRDRCQQKQLLDQAKLPTSTWKSLESLKDLLQFVEEQGLPLVLKKRLYGYDGYGTYIVKNKNQLNDFVNKVFQDHVFIAETFITFKREMAVIIARSADGSFTHLPFVETKQTEARCDWVKGPVKSKTTEAMVKKLKAFLKNLDYVGVMGVEFFQSKKGELIVNEVAPRVHNTGHYSMNTEGWSQFDLHNLCLVGSALPKAIKIKKAFAMTNLIGSGGKTHLKPVAGLHWYGKLENRVGRKMGHINRVAATPDQALKEAIKRRKDQQL